MLAAEDGGMAVLALLAEAVDCLFLGWDFAASFLVILAVFIEAAAALPLPPVSQLLTLRSF